MRKEGEADGLTRCDVTSKLDVYMNVVINIFYFVFSNDVLLNPNSKTFILIISPLGLPILIESHRTPQTVTPCDRRKG